MSRVILTLFLVLGLSCIAQAYLILDGQDSALAGRADQEGNCEDDNRRCLSNEGKCTNDQCVCKSGKVGDGKLGCVPQNFGYRCALTNDPSVKTFNNEFFGVPSPCRTQMFRYRYNWPAISNATTASGGKICTVRSFNFGERIKGKLFSGGFTVKIDVKRAGQTNDDRLNFRGFGTVELSGNVMKYKLQTLIKTNSGWEDAVDEPDVGVGYSVEQNDHSNRRIVFQSEECGLYIAWRPAHPDQGAHQVRVPGMFIAVNSNAPGEYEWPGNNKTVCSSPGGASMNASRINMNLNSMEEAAFKIAMLRVNQGSSLTSSQCTETSDAIDDCEDESKTACQEGIKRCLFLLSNPKSVDCQSALDETVLGDDILTNFRSCFNAICEGSRSGCNNALSNVMAEPCQANDFSGWTLNATVCDALPNA